MARAPSTARCTEHGVRLEEMLIVTDDGIDMVSTYKSHEIIEAG